MPPSVQAQLYEHFSRIAKALASPARLRILDLLDQAERTVEVLAHEAGLGVANASRHLQILRAARLVEGRRAGNHIFYRLADPTVGRFWRTLQDLGRRRLAEVRQLISDALHEHPGLEPVTRKDLRDRLRRGTVIVLDVRPTEEFRAGHIRGAVSIPIAELDRRLSELPRSRRIVAYCRGPYCLLAVEAVQLLRRRGYQARRYDGSVAEWRDRGLPVAVGGEPERARSAAVIRGRSR